MKTQVNKMNDQTYPVGDVQMPYDHWNTQDFIVIRLKKIGRITLDPCSNKKSIVKARHNIMPPQDGLMIPWKGFTYVNPPFSSIRAWVHYGLEQRFGPRYLKHLVFLLPFSPETHYFKKIWHTTPMNRGRPGRPSTVVGFPQSRFKFIDSKNKKRDNKSPMISSTLVYHGLEPKKFIHAFDDILTIVTNWKTQNHRIH